jgi:hypothetical protein
MKIIKENRKFGMMLTVDDSADPPMYAVVIDDTIAFTSSVEAAATIEYDDALAERRQPYVDRRDRDRAEGEARAMRAATVSRTYARSNQRGGRGGRGGV